MVSPSKATGVNFKLTFFLFHKNLELLSTGLGFINVSSATSGKNLAPRLESGEDG